MFSTWPGKFVEFVAQPLSSLNGVMACWWFSRKGFCVWIIMLKFPWLKTHPDHPTGQVGCEGLVSLSQNMKSLLIVNGTSQYERLNWLAIVSDKFYKKRSQTSSTSLHITTAHIAPSRFFDTKETRWRIPRHPPRERDKQPIPSGQENPAMENRKWAVGRCISCWIWGYSIAMLTHQEVYPPWNPR